MEKSITYVKERDIGFLQGITITAAGFLSALTRLFGLPAPFAAALIPAMNGVECIFLFVGAASGYVINGGLELCVPYIAAMSALALITLLSGIFVPEKYKTAVYIIRSAASGVSIFAANAVVTHSVYELFLSAAFGLISFVFAYCVQRLRSAGLKVLYSERKTADNAALCILFVFITAALTSMQIWVINIGVFLSALAILYSSDIKAEASLAVCAVLSSAGISIGRPEYSAASIMISVTAPVIMLTDRFGRITRACAFIVTVGVGMIVTETAETNGIAVMSASAAAVAYMVIPERYVPFTSSIARAESTTPSKPFLSFGKRLALMGDTVDEMKAAVNRTAKALEKENIRDVSWIYNKAADEICKSCHSNMKCWGSLYNDTADIMNKAVARLREGCFVTEEMLDGHLRTSCTERARLAASLNRQYAVFCAAENASRKISDMRNILTNQLGAAGSMLKKMSEELEHNDAYDGKAAETAEKVISETGLTQVSVLALIINGRLCLDAYGNGTADIRPDLLSDKLAFALERELDLPMISVTNGKTHITISERARYDAEVRVFRRNRTGEKHSGDCTECFNDGRGNVYMILSDGMGSGSRARIDSAFSCDMLSKLLKAGIDLEASLEMLNSSLLVKSDDESFSTADICKIDLNTGDVLLCKAGGAATYVRCGNTFAKIDEDGLPLGVGFKADYRGKLFRLSVGDVIIMTSDGAQLDQKWLEQLVMRDKHVNIKQIIDTAGEALRLSAYKENDDDITLIGVKLIR